MSGLVLKLRPAERVLINGVVIENGDRRSRLSVLTPDANILRLRDALHPSEAVTPVTRTCYVAQLLLAGESDPAEATGQLRRAIAQLAAVFIHGEAARHCRDAADHVEAGRIYQALRSLRLLRPLEEELMSRAEMGHA